MDVVLPKPGSYVVAVSGGVDSMVLLHLLREQAESDNRWKLTVAHLDHGIREDSASDRQLVQDVSQRYKLPFVYQEKKLGSGTSEAAARAARYEFLHSVRQASGAQAVLTAHHQDDVLETAIINMLRGSGRKGLAALGTSRNLQRPLLELSKQDLQTYARDQGLIWHEDSTNQDLNYLRNYVRHRLLPRFDRQSRDRLWRLINESRKINHELDTLLVNQLHLQESTGTVNRLWFNHLPHAVAREVLASWLRSNDIRNFDRRALERLVVAAKVGIAGQVFPIIKGNFLEINKDNLALRGVER